MDQFAHPSMYVRYPEGVVNYRHFIIMEVLPDRAVPGSKLEVIIGDVDSVGCFWVILLGKDYSEALETLTSEMQSTAMWLPMPREALLPGQFCAGFVDDAWRRVRIVGVDPGGEQATVSLVDRGGCRAVSYGALRWLPLKFAELPQQALCARFPQDLAGHEHPQLTSGRRLTFTLVDLQDGVLVLEPAFASEVPYASATKQVAECSWRSGNGDKKDTSNNVCCKLYRADLGLHVFCKDNCWMMSLKEVTERYVDHLHPHVVRAIAEALVPNFQLQFVNMAEFRNRYLHDTPRKCMLGSEHSQMVRLQDMPDLLRVLNINDLDL